MKMAILPKLVLVLIVGLLFSACDRASVAGRGNIAAPANNESGNNPPGSGNNLPTVSLTANGEANNLVVASGAQVQLVWASQNTNSCSLSEALTTGNPQTWTAAANGTQNISPTDQTTVTATCSNSAGQSATAQVVIYVTPTCVAKTVATPITTSVINNAPNQFVTYQISYTSCSGQPLSFPPGQVSYDNNGVSWTNTTTLPYSLSGTGISVQGNMDADFGTDLFGHTSACKNLQDAQNMQCYYHFVTDQTVTIPTGVSSFTFTVDMSNTILHNYGVDPSNPPPTETISTYLAFGNAQPAVAPINFINQ